MCKWSGLTFFFFFFQAEDGIRDWSVTGVQTCALPILLCVERYRCIQLAYGVNGHRPWIGRAWPQATRQAVIVYRSSYRRGPLPTMTIQQHGAPGTPPTENPPSSDDSASAEDTAPIPSIPSVPASLEVTPLGRSVIYRAIHSEAEWTPWARRLRADATMAQLYNATTDALYSSDPYTPDRRGLLRAAAQVLCYLQSAAATTLTGTALVGVPQTIYEACDAQRARQIAQWGGAEHDREHGPGTWMRMLQKQFEIGR